MATIYPKYFIPKYRLNGEEDRSEELVFKAFRDLKYEEIIIYHSRNYLNKNLKDQFYDGEVADFLVVHPKKGMIFFETKNINNLSYKSDEGLFYDENSGKSFDPIEQAKIHKLNFKNKIKHETDLELKVPFIHAVIFPKNSKPENFKNFRIDIKPEQIIWREDFRALRMALDDIFDLQKSSNYLTAQDLKKLNTMLMGRDIKNPIGKILHEIESDQEINLSEQQELIMTAMHSANKKLAIKGLAGTGKTILLAKKAVDEVNLGKKVLILTKTKPINKFLKLLTKIENKDLIVTNIDQFPKLITDKDKLDQYRNLRPGNMSNYSPVKSKNEDDDEKRIFFDEKLPNYCFEIFEKNPEKKFDLILIDEAQDFHKNWFETLCLSINDDGQIIFFYDPFQEQISNSMVLEIEKANDIFKYALFRNYRNTIEITHLLQKLIIKYFPKTEAQYHFQTDSRGDIPILDQYQTWDEQVTKVCDTIKHLINNEKIYPKHIAVIYDGSMRKPEDGTLYMNKEISKIAPTITAEDYSEPYTKKDKENHISIDSIRRFKGLEKRAIILTNIEDLTKETAKNLYTGLSRARAKLIILAKEKAIAQIKDLI